MVKFDVSYQVFKINVLPGPEKKNSWNKGNTETTATLSHLFPRLSNVKHRLVGLYSQHTDSRAHMHDIKCNIGAHFIQGLGLKSFAGQTWPTGHLLRTADINQF